MASTQPLKGTVGFLLSLLLSGAKKKGTGRDQGSDAHCPDLHEVGEGGRGLESRVE